MASAQPRPDPAAAAMPNGQALVIAGQAADLRERMALIGFGVEARPDPYSAMVEISRRPLAFRAVLLSLAAVHPSELALIGVLKQRFPHLELIVADAAGRPAALAEARRLGADAILEEDRLHRISKPTGAEIAAPAPSTAANSTPQVETVLTNEELRALLQE